MGGPMLAYEGEGVRSGEPLGVLWWGVTVGTLWEGLIDGAEEEGETDGEVVGRVVALKEGRFEEAFDEGTAVVEHVGRRDGR